MSEYFPNVFQEMIYKSRYSRYLHDQNRREEWPETVARYFDFFTVHLNEKCGFVLDKELRTELEQAILSHLVVPSMRCLMTAGPALQRENCAGYNCSYIAIDSTKMFAEIMYSLMNGCGVGFSVERQYINKLPEIPEELYPTDTTIIVPDSKLGWAKSFNELITLLYTGHIPCWNMTKVRPAGAILKTFGGRASGPGVPEQLFKFTVDLFQRNKGQKLTSLDVHDLVCSIADCIVSGGVRRCLKKGSAIQTSDGYKLIENISTDDFIVTKGKNYRVLVNQYTGKQKTIKIKHRFGELPSCSENHQIAVFDSFDSYYFKSAKDIKIGDRLLFDTAGVDGKEQYLPISKYNGHFNASDFKIPEKINEDIAWLIGLIHGDGYIGEHSIEISGNKNDIGILNRANDIFLSEFGLSSSIEEDRHISRNKIKKGNGISIRIRIHSRGLTDWFREYIKQSNNPLLVPNFIRGACRSVRAAYISGLFDADGRITGDNRIDQCETIYKSFAEELVSLLATLGIATRILFNSAEKRRLKGEKAKDHYTLRIVGNLNRKNWCLITKNYCYSIKRNIINEEKFRSSIDFSWPDNIHNSINHKGRNQTTISAGTDSNVFQPIPVIAIIYDDELVDTYDLEIEDIHQFTTNGIVVHNSALISLSNLSDDRMRSAKTGQWWIVYPYRANANNSAVYNERFPEMGTFINEWKSLYDSKSGERGIFSRWSATNVIKRSNDFRLREFGKDCILREWDYPWGSNPCSEILMRFLEYCNLTELIVRAIDNLESLKNKVRIAAILGTWQSTLVDFKFLSKKWRQNCEDERLLGVSMTGIMDNRLTSGQLGYEELKYALTELRKIAITTNWEWSKKLGINQSVSCTCTKPSGTVSALNDTSSGIHARHAPYYLRSVRFDKNDPLAQLMIEQGVYVEDDNIRPQHNYVFYFPLKSPDGAICRNDVDAIKQLELWKIYQLYWTEHKPSVTISVKENEWMDVGAWVYKNFEWTSGISFLPFSDHTYQQAPFQDLTEQQYNEWVEKTPKNINFGLLTKYENTDTTTGSQELSCSASTGCEI